MKNFIAFMIFAFVGLAYTVEAAGVSVPIQEKKTGILEQIFELTLSTSAEAGSNLAVSVDQLKAEHLYACASSGAFSVPDEPEAVVEVEPEGFFSKYSFQDILNFVLLVLTSVFGAVITKGKGKLKEALDLLTCFHAALEDNKFSQEELYDIKQRYYKLIGKSAT